MAKRATRTELATALIETDMQLRGLKQVLLEIVGEELEVRQLRALRKICRQNRLS